MIQDDITPEQALENLWAVAMEASLPLKNYTIVAKSIKVLKETITSANKEQNS